MNRVFLFVVFSFFISSSFSQNNYRCYWGEYISGVDTIYLSLELKAAITKRYTSQFTFTYYVNNKPEKELSRILYCKEIDFAFYLSIDSTRFALNWPDGYFENDLSLKFVHVSFMNYKPNEAVVFLEDITSQVSCGDNQKNIISKEIGLGNGEINTKADAVDFCEVEPSFPGGKDSLANYLMTNLGYPMFAKEASVQGTVYVQFIVEKDGSITNGKIITGVCKELDKEALRLVNAMPNWIPGKDKGVVVRCRYTIPVNFRIERE